jgi:AraC family transcriptional regulator
MELSIRQSPFGGRVIKTHELSDLRLVEGVYSGKTKVPRHAHEQAVFCIALNGLCNEAYASKLREYKPFTVEFLPSNQCHSLTFPGAETRAFSVDVASSWLERAREYSLKLEDSVHCHGGLLSGLFMKLYREFRQMDGASPWAIEGLVLEMLAEVSRREVKVSDRTPPRWLAQALELLREQFSEHLTLAHVATSVGVHPIHLARGFRRFCRCTVGEYIRQLRIEHACRELCESDASLAAIASAAGFSDQSHFSRTFKRLMAMTPAQYREAFSRANPIP